MENTTSNIIPTEPEVVEFYNEVVEIIDEFVEAAIKNGKHLKIHNVIEAVAKLVDVDKCKLVRFLNLFNCKYTKGKELKYVLSGTLVSGYNFHTIKTIAIKKLAKNKSLKNEWYNR